MQHLLRCSQEAFGRVDLFFNNAGVIGEPSKGVLDTPLDSWRWVLDTNVMGLLNGMQTFVPAMTMQVGTLPMLVPVGFTVLAGGAMLLVSV